MKKKNNDLLRTLSEFTCLLSLEASQKGTRELAHYYKKQSGSHFDSQCYFFHHLFVVTYFSTALSCYNSITLQIKHPEYQAWYDCLTAHPPTSRSVHALHRNAK